jgi:hypothetical protein
MELLTGILALFGSISVQVEGDEDADIELVQQWINSSHTSTSFTDNLRHGGSGCFAQATTRCPNDDNTLRRQGSFEDSSAAVKCNLDVIYLR